MAVGRLIHNFDPDVRYVFSLKRDDVFKICKTVWRLTLFIRCTFISIWNTAFQIREERLMKLSVFICDSVNFKFLIVNDSVKRIQIQIAKYWTVYPQFSSRCIFNTWKHIEFKKNREKTAHTVTNWLNWWQVFFIDVLINFVQLINLMEVI